MDTTVKLECRFMNEEGKSSTLSVNQPAMDLEPAVIQEAMETIVAQGIFKNKGFQLYQEVKGARYVTRTVDNLFEVKQA